MICSICGIEWTGNTPASKCARCMVNPQGRSILADAPPMPAGELQALIVQLKQFGWTGSSN